MTEVPPPVILAVGPAGAPTRDAAPTVGPLSLSAPTSSANSTDSFDTGYLGTVFERMMWWRYESATESPTQVWFDAMRSTNRDRELDAYCYAAVVLLMEDGRTFWANFGSDPVDGRVERGAVLSPPVGLGEVVHVGIGMYDADAAEVLYRLRVSAPSELRGWVQMPTRDGYNAVNFDPEGVSPGFWEPDPEMPYVPPGAYNVGFRDSLATFTSAGVFNLHKLSTPPWPPNYDGGGPYADIFRSAAAMQCVQAHAVRDGHWNSEGAKWGGYWRDVCPPMLTRLKPSSIAESGSGTVSVRLALDYSRVVVTDPDSINADYQTHTLSFSLHEAHQIIGPSGGWLIQNQMLDEVRQEEDRSPEIVWEDDLCEILNVYAVRGYGDVVSPTGAALDATWRGGTARLYGSTITNPWGPYLEPRTVGEDGQVFAWAVNHYGSIAGPDSMAANGPVAFDTLRTDPAFSVSDWQAAYDLEEQLSATWTDSAGVHKYWPAPGLIYIAAPDNYDSLGVDGDQSDEVDANGNPVGGSKDLTASITGTRLSYRMDVRPSRFRFRFTPSIPAVFADYLTPDYLTPAIVADLLDTGQRYE